MGAAPRTWLAEARFGLSLHWGAYSSYERGEHVLLQERLSPAAYRARADALHGERLDLAACAEAARQAGMRFGLLMARPADGLALYASRYADWTMARMGCRRDLVAEFVRAFRLEGLRVGLGYCLADWHAPAYFAGPQGDPAGWRALVERTHSQVEELCRGYGSLDLLWFEGDEPYTPSDWGLPALVSRLKAIQPMMLCAGRQRLGLDVAMAPEPAAWPPTMPWLAPLAATPPHRGYHRGAQTWRSAQETIQVLAAVASQGGALALEVGLEPNGALPFHFGELAREMGGWLASHGDAVYGVSPGPCEGAPFGYTAVNGNTLYLHVLHWPGPELRLFGLRNRVLRARYLSDGWRITFEQAGDVLTLLDLPSVPPAPHDVVIALDLNGEPQCALDGHRRSIWTDGATLAAWAGEGEFLSRP